MMIEKPKSGEYPEFYEQYIQLIPKVDVLNYLEEQIQDIQAFYMDWQNKDTKYRYAPGKWSVKEITSHLSDTERVFAYRAMCISRNEQMSLPGFDQDQYVTQRSLDHLSFKDLIDELISLRVSNLRMFRNFSENMWKRKGMANGLSIHVKAIPFIVAGHLKHHLNIISERYK